MYGLYRLNYDLYKPSFNLKNELVENNHNYVFMYKY